MGEEQARWIASVVGSMCDDRWPAGAGGGGGCSTVEPSAAAEAGWCKMMTDYGEQGQLWTQCSNWYNRSGAGLAIYTGDVRTYQQRLDDQEFESLEFA